MNARLSPLAQISMNRPVVVVVDFLSRAPEENVGENDSPTRGRGIDVSIVSAGKWAGALIEKLA